MVASNGLWLASEPGGREGGESACERLLGWVDRQGCGGEGGHAWGRSVGLWATLWWNSRRGGSGRAFRRSAEEVELRETLAASPRYRDRQSETAK